MTIETMQISQIKIDTTLQPRADRIRKTRSDAARLRNPLIEKHKECYICGFDIPEVLQVHHAYSVSEGGGNEEYNLTVLCPTCHKLVHSASKKMHGQLVDSHASFDRYKKFDSRLREAMGDCETDAIWDLARRVTRG